MSEVPVYTVRVRSGRIYRSYSKFRTHTALGSYGRDT
jgi:hypothetical protein